jgi:lysophospholipase L1-like esterase
MRYLLCALIATFAACSDDDDSPAVAAPVEVVFLGDSITRNAVNAGTVNAQKYTSVGWGVPGFTAELGKRYVALVLRDRPNASVVVVGFGTNDAYNNNTPVAAYKANVLSIIQLIQAAGRKAVLTLTPYSLEPELAGLPLYNAALEELIVETGAYRGADLYSWFLAHPGELSADMTHPNDQGYSSIGSLWESALDEALK